MAIRKSQYVSVQCNIDLTQIQDHSLRSKFENSTKKVENRLFAAQQNFSRWKNYRVRAKLKLGYGFARVVLN